ncbi:Rpn family recombination-promoting nuclease/putative transposase [Brachyspira aalborgi]|jgi:predicted transposase/invertase (TIGR01784 family)|uniref:Rpn family recombination-promoting nuclease/putative transposase n=1 Tax=Brachyspira aalborgi TaxID=29522 RepID=A0AB38PY57_9SPIR|nr:Rpn family recombination-promoting nuclease/putative transposase [Brachyspira aalborgi]MBS4762685.1 Rpn family recombination-promoting nuclease/putative transposase [Brachyspira sp.]TXJ14923.1 Rpn family recombination-promoting nuclease/putative transposase [Brachyspira aalborgi]TXJ18441.1 Rpn family recombination-promoting nuclease/putative transposase [Brachyspira aalborgi]TXJ24395.1 Rpn family recombination-promoting nuclease/putative transposase [Brachyspira aalborgi]TXJ32753.1 Rpn fami
MNKPFNALNDCFVRYFFTDKGGEKVLLDFINAVMISADMKTFKAVEILNPFNLKKNYNDKETIVDVKCITKNGTVVIIEVQLSGNSRFPERILYYWSANYSKLLKKGEEYEDLTPVISINLLNFNLNKVNKNVHSCYMIYDTKNARLLTDHLQIHIIELKKFKFKDNDLKKDLNYWLGFFTTNNMEAYMSEIVKEKPIMEEAHKRYNNFIRSRLMMSEYEKKELYQYDKQITLEEKRREGIKEGRREGKLEGIKERNYSIAKSLKSSGLDNQFISKHTGLSVEEIEKL